jgi:hypothetical protein
MVNGRMTRFMRASDAGLLGDPYNKLLLHFDDNVVDYATGKTVTPTSLTYSTETPFASGKSGSFSGSGTYLSVPDSDDWDYGSSSFTVEGFFRFAVLSGVHTLFAQQETTSKYLELRYTTASNRFTFVDRTGTSTWNVELFIDYTLTTNTWYHIALVRNGNTWYFFVNGVAQTLTWSVPSGTPYTGALQAKAAALQIGYTSVGGYFNGQIDEFRVSKGIARYTANFTPPTEPFA